MNQRSSTGRRGIFLDRDGTLVHARHYPSLPEHLVLYDGIGPGLVALQEVGFKLVVVTNQSGIARGYFTEDDLERMHAHVAREVDAFGVRIDGFYFCPHHPEGTIEHLAVRCDCRKPAPGMVLRAANDLGIDPQVSWFVGDILDDIEAGNRAGCRTVLVDLGTESLPTASIRTPDYVARDTVHALAIIAACEGIGGAAELDYRPASWTSQSSPTETGVVHAIGG